MTHSPAIAPPRAPRADAVRNRAAVIAAARKVMSKKGLEAGIDEIARAAKVGVGTVYRHFPTKDELVRGLAADRFARLAELAHDALAQDEPWEAFCEFIRRAGAIQSEDRALSEVLVSRPETMREAAEAVGILDLTGEIMRRAQAEGHLRGDAEPEDVPMLMCALAGAFHNPMTNSTRYLGIVLDGLRAPGACELPARG
jgi:AcrR family transcriptional regulator